MLALIFTGLQGVEYSVSSFTISDGAFGSCFYLATGFHGLTSKPAVNLTNKNRIKKEYATSSLIDQTDTSMLCPYWISGFADAEATFSLRLSKGGARKTKWHVSPIFSIELHKRGDLALLVKIQAFFGVGAIYVRGNRDTAIYYVQSFIDLTTFISPHFSKYPLLTKKKRADFILFKQALELLNLKTQSSDEGLQKIVNIRASINKGLSDILKIAFPKTIPVTRPLVNFEGIPHPNWLVGFVDGEGCFYVNTKKAKSKLGIQVISTFFISQHSRDELLLSKIIDYLGCGSIEKSSTRIDETKFIVYKFSDIFDKVIPFFFKPSFTKR